MKSGLLPLMMVLSLCAGCVTSRSAETTRPSAESTAPERTPLDMAGESAASDEITQVDFVPEEESPESAFAGAMDRDAEEIPLPEGVGDVVSTTTLEDVVGSVYSHYPLLQAALYSRNVAAGEQVAAMGNYDLKLKAASENGPTGFYETYRQSIGVVQPLYGGADVFAGYRVGRGFYEPWYLERQTNDGGEFKAGAIIPFARNRHIDARRAELWRATFGVQAVEPDIQAQLIGFVQEASYAYWDFVAAGEEFDIARRVLDLALDRTSRIEAQVEAGLIDPPELTDNLRLVAERRGTLASVTRKLREKALKLSLFFRDVTGMPVVLSEKNLATFPDPEPIDPEQVDFDATLALQTRPELKLLAFTRRQYEVDFEQARNDTRANVDGLITGSQDMGQPTSSKRDKSQFEAETSLFVDVPLQRRKGRGKMQAVEGKLAQLGAKTRMVEDKIVAEVRAVYAALIAAREQVVQAELAVEYAEDLAGRERNNFQQGASDLLKVSLREQYAVESALKKIDALQLYFEARADYRAIMAQDAVVQ